MPVTHLQGRKIELMYLNFYTEQYGTLGLALTSADLLHPTDVIVNFGVWLSDTPPNTTCGATRSYWPNIGRCPYMHDVCEYFMGKASTHAFNLWWATTTPGLDKKDLSRVIEKVPFGHNLNAESACGCATATQYCTGSTCSLVSLCGCVRRLPCTAGPVICDVH